MGNLRVRCLNTVAIGRSYWLLAYSLQLMSSFLWHSATYSWCWNRWASLFVGVIEIKPTRICTWIWLGWYKAYCCVDNVEKHDEFGSTPDPNIGYEWHWAFKRWRWTRGHGNYSYQGTRNVLGIQLPSTDTKVYPISCFLIRDVRRNCPQARFTYGKLR